MTARRSPGNLLPVLLLTLLAALCAATFLFAPVSITLDGYSHLYNANALRWMLAGQPAAHGAFTYNSWLIPNWATALILAALCSILPATIALRILILFIGAALVAGLYSCVETKKYSTGERAQLLIILLPFALSAFLPAGFYDFLLSTAFCFLILGLELRHGTALFSGLHAPPLRVEITIAIFLLAAWLAHPLPLALTFVFPAAMLAGEIIEHGQGALTGRRIRGFIRHLWPWALPASLMAWFYLHLRTAATAVPEATVTKRLFGRLSQLGGGELAAISPSGNTVLLFVILVVILLATVLTAIHKPAIRTWRASVLLVLAIFTLLLFLLVPEGVGDASAIPPRVFLLSVLFLVLLAFSHGVASPVMRTAAMAISAVIVVGFAWEYWTVSNRMKPAFREINAAMDTLPAHSRILIAGYSLAPDCDGPALYERSVPERHWAAAGAIGKELIVLNDYEGYTSHFPLKYVNGRAQDVEEVRTGPGNTIAEWTSFLNSEPVADYVVAWGAPSAAESPCRTIQPMPLEAVLKNRYELIQAKDGASHVEIWKSR